MPVPLLDVNAQNHPLREELLRTFERVLGHGRFILGEEVERFEEMMVVATEARHAIGVSSGTDALILALLAAGIGPGDEVICPAFTFFATAGAVVRVGATPVFADVCPVCFNLDPAAARRAVTAKTRAILPVHLFGQAADMQAIMAVANENGLVVIEDAAQSIGARTRGRAVGTIGGFGAFSFFPSKNLGGFGDSGLLTTMDDDLAAKARRLRVHGMEPKYYHHEVGGNFRMDALQAALLAVKAPHEPAYRAARRAHAARYLKILGAHPAVAVANPLDCRCLSAQDERLSAGGTLLVLPNPYPHNEAVWNQFTLRVTGGGRDSLLKHLQCEGIGCEIYYPVPLHHQKCFADLPKSSRPPCPVAERLASEVLSLPVYPEMSESQQDEVIGSVTRWLERAAR